MGAISTQQAPVDLELERELLAELVYGPSQPAFSDILLEDFTLEDHRLILLTLQEILAEGHERPGIATVRVRSSQAGRLIQDSSLGEIAAAVETQGTNLRPKLRALRRLTVLRRLHRLGVAIDSGSRAWSDDVIERAHADLEAASALADPGGQNETTRATIERMVANLGMGPDPRRVYTGLSDLDDQVNALRSKDYVIVGARPSVGKTAFGLTVALNAARDEHPVAFITLEHGAEALITRAIAQLQHCPLRDLLSDYPAVDVQRQGLGALASMPFEVLTPKPTLEAIRQSLLAKRGHSGLGLAVVDYVQLIQVSDARTDVERVTRISHGLRALAIELDTPLIALSQLSRAPEQRGEGSKPRNSDLRGSGELEQDADQIWMLTREGTEATLGVTKNRNGATGSIPLTFIAAEARFANAASQAQSWT